MNSKTYVVLEYHLLRIPRQVRRVHNEFIITTALMYYYHYYYYSLIGMKYKRRRILFDGIVDSFLQQESKDEYTNNFVQLVT